MGKKFSSQPKRGYLNSDFALFHLKDMKSIQFEYHYHDFNKIIVFISGSVTYLIEGTAYRLKPWDILFISSNELHRPIIDPSFIYERIVIWVNPGFLHNHSYECSLFTCFNLTNKEKSNLLRLDSILLSDVKHILLKLEDCIRSNEFGASILKNSFFLQLIVVLTRELLGTKENCKAGDIVSDYNILNLLQHINMNLNTDLSIDALARKYYLSRYYLMHKFKQQTGFSIHSYILHKRLIKADTLIRSGMPAGEACEQSGFNDYSSFVKAFKRMFGVSPRDRFIK